MAPERMQVRLIVGAATLAIWGVSARIEQEGEVSLAVPGLGTLRGRHADEAGDVHLFAGLRFAEPPVGDLRWRPPQPVKPRGEAEDVDATKFGPPCMQPVGYGAAKSPPGDEDCLFLNVYKPSADGTFPVMVFIHGGSFYKGTANPEIVDSWGPLYNGTYLAAQGAVVVTLQYRLGIFGFLAGESLRARDTVQGSTGNYGLQDQRLALQWVQAHIDKFSGDPQRVLLFGQSAGAASVNWHLVSNASQGLFSSAALQSGANADWGSMSMKDAEWYMRRLLRETGCHDVACLVEKPANLLAAKTPDFVAPAIDGVELMRPLAESVAAGQVARVPVIVGFTRDESSPGTYQLNMTEDEFDAFLENGPLPPSLRPVVKSDYMSQYSSWYWMSRNLGTALGMGCTARDFAHSMAALGVDVYGFKFSRQPAFPVERMYGPLGETSSFMWGAYHGAELPFVFGNAAIPAYNAILDKKEQDIAAQVSAHWLSMAANGHPQQSWQKLPSSKTGRGKWLLLDSGSQSMVEAHLFPEVCRMLDRHRLLSATVV